MDKFFTVLFIVLLVSAVIRHVFRTIDIVSDMREKAVNRRLERFKH